MLVLAAAAPSDLSRAHKLITLDLKYAEAIELLEGVLREGELAPKDRVQAGRLLGIASAATGDQQRAEQAFVEVLELEPTYRLDARHSPKIRQAFENAQKTIAERPKIRRVIALPEGTKVEVIATLHDPKKKVQALLLFSRFKPGRFEQNKMNPNPKGARLTLNLPDRLETRLEYYVQANDSDGLALARVGSPQAPSSLVINRQLIKAPDTKEVEPAPWYGKWWVWVIAGGVVAAAGATTFALVRSGNNEPMGTLDPIRIN